MSYSSYPQMGKPDSPKSDAKNKPTIVVSIIALLVSAGALLTSVMSYQQSVKSNDISAGALGVARSQESIAKGQADLAQREAQGRYTAAFTVRLKRDNKDVSEEVSWSKEEDFTILANEFRAKTTWLSIDITNTGDKPIVVHDIGLITDRKEQSGAWARDNEAHKIQRPDRCGQGVSDIRCFRFSLTVAVGKYLILDWPVWIDADLLLKHKAVDPVAVGIYTNTGTQVVETNLVVR